MSKLEKLHEEAINNNYEITYRNMEEIEIINSTSASQSCAIITKNVTIHFAEWLNLNTTKSDNNNTFLNLGYFFYENEVKTTEQLFNIFIETL
jgi:hypothetical protein